MKADCLRKSTLWNVNPLVLTIDHFICADDCDAMIAAAAARTKRATVYSEKAGHERSAVRSNSTCLLDPAEYPWALSLFSNVGSLIGLPCENAEGVSVLHYRKGEQFKPHFDSFAIDGTPRHKMILEKGGGQRLYTAICYLNDDFCGGGTQFPDLGLTIEPGKGKLLLFANTRAGSTEPSPASLHAGLPVANGEKWAATVWWRERRFPYELLRAASSDKITSPVA